MTSRVLTVELSTASAVEDTFPVAVSAPFAVASCKVVRVRNVTAPDSLPYSAVWAHWEPSGSLVRLLYVTGLDASTRYLIDLEVSDA